MGVDIKRGLILGAVSILVMIGAYFVIDNSSIFWGVFLMLYASRLDRSAVEAIRGSREYKNG